MTRRVRISPTLADRLGPDAMAIIERDLARRAARIRTEAQSQGRRVPTPDQMWVAEDKPLRRPSERVDRCRCGGDGPDGGCMYVDGGYPWCRPCCAHHRAPECAIDSDGRALNPYTGQPWDDDWWRTEDGGPVCPTCGHAQADHDEHDGCGACAMQMQACRWWPS